MRESESRRNQLVFRTYILKNNGREEVIAKLRLQNMRDQAQKSKSGEGLSVKN